MININIKSKSIFAVTLILALFLCIGLVSASDFSTDISTSSNSNDVQVVENNNINANVANSEDSATAADDDDSFTALNQTINSGAKDIVLDKDYKFNSEKDAAFIKSGGIRILRQGMTIDGQGHTIDCAGAVRFLYSENFTITLKNLEIKNGYVPKSTSVADCCGGAVFIKNANGIFENVEFKYNYAYNRGGAVAIIGGNGEFKNSSETVACRFIQNNASYGGAVDIMNGNGIFHHGTTFNGNTALDAGGAVRINSGNGTFYFCDFGGNNCNETNAAGGALYFSNTANVTIVGCKFQSNKAKNGGAIYISNSKRTGIFVVKHTHFTSNFAEVAGGAIVISNTIAQLENATFRDNSGNYKGGAVDWESSEGYFANCHFHGNYLNDDSPFRNYSSTSQKIGGAIYIAGSNDDIISVGNCSFTNNNASLHYGYGGAIALIKGNLTVEYDTTRTEPAFENNTVGNIVYTNGIYNGEASYAQAFATMSAALPTAVTYGINAPLNITINCVNTDIPIYGRITLIHDGQVVYTNFINETAALFQIWPQYLPVGEHNYTLTFEGPNFKKMTENFTLNVAENTNDYNFQIENMTYGDSVIVTVKSGLDDLDYGEIYVIFGNRLFIGNVNNGTLTVPYTVPAGDYHGFIVLDPAHFASSTAKMFDVTVAQKPIHITATSLGDITYGEKAVISVVLNETIDTLAYIQIGTKYFYGYITNGTGNITIPDLSVGLHNFKVLLSDASFEINDAEVNVDVVKAGTEVDIKNAAFVINYDGSYTITVLNVSKGVINVTLAGKSLGTFKTDEKGVAIITLTAAQLRTAGAGSKVIAVTYDGDKNHKPSEATATLTINKEATKFANVKAAKSSYKSTAKSIQLTATLKNSKNQVIKNQVVVFKVNNKKSYSVKTNSKGVATLTLNSAKIKACKLNKKGNYKFTTTYKTTATYNQATATGKIKIVK